MASSLTLGGFVPGFQLLNQRGELVTLEDFKGKRNLVLYFYPRALTPGCTVQACGLRDVNDELAVSDTVVLGVSPDSPAKLQKFADKYNLNFDLLADQDHAIAEAYGAWGLKKFMGREFMGVLRMTFLIDKEGRLQYVMEKVKTKTHEQDVLTCIREVFSDRKI